MPTSKHQAHGLVATSGRNRIILPLKGVKCDFTVAGGFVEVRMTQVFFQENATALDCRYLFPLPADAAVYRCEVTINERVIRAQTEEREAARNLARARREVGHRTALVEAERDNLFTLSLGNIQPRDLVQVELAYFQPLRRTAGTCAVELPFCPGVRYIPGKPLLRSNSGKGIEDDTDEVPDASRISPPRIDAEHPDAAFVDVKGRIEARFVRAGRLVSPSHAIESITEDGWVRLSLTDGAEIPDRDFVVRWEEEAPVHPTSRAWTHQHESDSFALLEIRAPEADGRAEALPQDVYFLVDRSGSMQGVKWTKAVEALQSCVRVLGVADRAMITFFNAAAQDFAEKPMSPAELLGDTRFIGVAEIGTTGGTQLGPALTHVLSAVRRHSPHRRKNLVLITDAQVGNESSILEILRDAPGLPVHCFGLDVALNDGLLLAITRQQGGTFHSLHPHDDIAAAVTALGRTLGQPVLMGLGIGPGWELASPLPDLYAGQVHFASVRGRGDAELRLAARDARGEAVELQFTTAPAPGPVPFLHWSKARLDNLLDRNPADAEAVRLSKAANLICRVTAFVAWDEAEKIAIATDELVQPNLEVSEADLRDAGYISRLCCMESLRQDIGLPLFAPTRAKSEPHEDPARIKTDLRNQLLSMLKRMGDSAWLDEAEILAQWAVDPEDPGERRRRIEKLLGVLPELGHLTSRVEGLRAEVQRNLHELRELFRRGEGRVNACLDDPSPQAVAEELVRHCERARKVADSLFAESQGLANLEQQVRALLRGLVE